MAETNTPLNEWATAGTKTEPDAPKRAEGWLLEEAPPFENFNFQWAEWIDRFNFLYKNPSQSYNAAIDYNGAGQMVLGSDSALYVSVQSNGPATTVQDPTTDVGDVFWELLSSTLNLGTAASRNVGTAVGNVAVYIDGSQNLTGNVTGSAATWTTSRSITLTGEVSGNASFNGGSNFNLNCVLPNAGTMFIQDTGVAGGDFRTNSQNEALFAEDGISGAQVRTNTQLDARFVLGQAGILDANFRTNLQNDGRFVLGQAGTGGTNFRTNTQNDGRFLQSQNQLSEIAALGVAAKKFARENIGIFSGRVSSAGASINLPTSWSSTRLSTGNYRITHNTGVELNFAPAADNGAVGNGIIVGMFNSGTATFDVSVRTPADNATDREFTFVATIP